MSIDLRAFVDRVIVPALLDRFLREQARVAPVPVGSVVCPQTPVANEEGNA
jgi:hypothetical protein